MGPPRAWAVSGPYFEACSCDAICPCRAIAGIKGGPSTYGICDFALGWTVAEGHADETDLGGLNVVIAGSYDDDEAGSPWRVLLYVDERANDAQAAALEAIFLGRAGGTAFANYGRFIDEVLVVRRARIEIEHAPTRRRIKAGGWVEVAERDPVESELPVSCGIPGHDHPGQEVVANALEVADDAVRFAYRGRCGFATSYSYRSDSYPEGLAK